MPDIPPKLKRFFNIAKPVALLLFASFLIIASAFSGFFRSSEPSDTGADVSVSELEMEMETEPDPKPETKPHVETKSEYINSCVEYSYKEISRQPQLYKGKRAVFTGKVLQMMEESPEINTTVALLINVTEGEYSWSDTLYAVYKRTIIKASRILDGDIITFYGEIDDLYTYESIWGQSITLPKINIKYYELIE